MIISFLVCLSNNILTKHRYQMQQNEGSQIQNVSGVGVPVQSTNQVAVSRGPLLKINADNQQTIRMCVLRVGLIVVLIMIFLLGLAIPKPLMVLNNELVFKGSSPTSSQCNPSAFDANRKVYCNNFTTSNPVAGLVAQDIRRQHQFILLYLQIILNENVTFTLNQNIQVQAYKLESVPKQQPKQYEMYVRDVVYDKTFHYEIKVQNLIGFDFIGDKGTSKKYMYQFLFAYDRQLVRMNQNKGDYVVFVRFFDTNQTGIAQKITLEALAMNPKFTTFTIDVRAFYCILSFVTAIIFIRRYCQLNAEDRILEIKFVAMISILLIFYNDPFYAITVLIPNGSSIFFSTFFVVNLLVFLLVLWVFFLRRIYYEPDQRDTELTQIKRSWPFYLFFLGLYMAIIALFLQYSYYALKKPIILSTSLKQMNVIPTIVIIAVLLAGIVIYQIVLLAFIIRKYCCQPGNQILWRHRNYITLYPFFLLMFIIFFIVGGSMPYNYSGVWILYGYSFINIFVLVLQYLYYTPAAELEQQQQHSHQILQPPHEKNSINSDLQFQPSHQQHINAEQREDKTDLQDQLGNK